MSLVWPIRRPWTSLTTFFFSLPDSLLKTTLWWPITNHACSPSANLMTFVFVWQTSNVYAFQWRVRNKEINKYYGHQESKDGSQVTGSYQVLLPDGRLQIVNYVANNKGFFPEISYGTVTRETNETFKAPVWQTIRQPPASDIKQIHPRLKAEHHNYQEYQSDSSENLDRDSKIKWPSIHFTSTIKPTRGDEIIETASDYHNPVTLHNIADSATRNTPYLVNPSKIAFYDQTDLQKSHGYESHFEPSRALPFTLNNEGKQSTDYGLDYHRRSPASSKVPIAGWKTYYSSPIYKNEKPLNSELYSTKRPTMHLMPESTTRKHFYLQATIKRSSPPQLPHREGTFYSYATNNQLSARTHHDKNGHYSSHKYVIWQI